MKRKTLSNLIMRQVSFSTIISTLIVSSILFIAFYFVSSYVIDSNQKELRKNSIDYLEYAIDREAALIEVKMKNITDMHQNIFTMANLFYKNPEKFSILDPSLNYPQDKKGIYYQSKDIGGSDAIAFPFTTKNKEEITASLNKMQWFDLPLKTIVDSNKEVLASWVFDSDALIRYYPFINLHKFLTTEESLLDWNFYYEADLAHNPGKKALWSTIYYDAPGQSWMGSYIQPVYDQNNTMRAVVGVDVPIFPLVKKLLPQDLPFDAEVILTDKNGMVIAMSNEMERLFEFKEMQKTSKDKEGVVNKNILMTSEHNLLTSSNRKITEQFKKYFENKTESGKFVLKNIAYIVEAKSIKPIEWKIFFFVAEDTIIKKSIEIKKMTQSIVFYILSIFILLLLLVSYYSHRRSRKLSHRLSQPIIELTHATKEMKRFKKPNKRSNIEEIDNLFDNFDTMVHEVKAFDEKLEKEVEKKTKSLKIARDQAEKLASQDPLTHLLNRRSFSELSENNLDLARRYKYDLSIVMVDIDHFKKINDTYGHSVGDDVIVMLADILREVFRRSDIIARYGGEEFIALLPKTSQERAMSFAERLRSTVQQSPMQLKGSKDVFITVSIGVSKVENGLENAIEKAIKQADSNLYAAKEGGRNKVVG